MYYHCSTSFISHFDGNPVRTVNNFCNRIFSIKKLDLDFLLSHAPSLTLTPYPILISFLCFPLPLLSLSLYSPSPPFPLLPSYRSVIRFSSHQISPLTPPFSPFLSLSPFSLSPLSRPPFLPLIVYHSV
jgi:hypothetical protein